MAALDLNLHPKQGEAFLTEATEVLYGGAAGGGKSHLIRVAAVTWCAAIAGLQVYLFRRIRDDLVKNHMEGPNGFRSMLAGWVEAGLCSIVEDEIRFWNGSKIYLCHCKDEKDIYKYQGAEIHALLIDEATHFAEAMYRFLRNRVRMVGLKLPAAYVGKFPRVLLGANPGNIGHAWVKATFVDFAAPMEIRQASNDEGGMLRQYIPARLDDNPSMLRDDPGYEARLSGLGSESLVRAMRDGDWDVVEGAFFAEIDRGRHAVRPFAIPKNWGRFRSFDWGSAKPFSVGWWAIVQDTFKTPCGRVLPRGCLVRYREWYGAKSPNVGLKLTAEAVGAGIAQREQGDAIDYGVADPAIWKVDGGPSIAERMRDSVSFRQADNKRQAGWDQLRARLVGEDGLPMLVVFDTCLDWWRTLPAMQHDKNNAEDMNSDLEDHAADETRYACMSRPWIATPDAKKRSARGADYGTEDDEDESNWKVA